MENRMLLIPHLSLSNKTTNFQNKLFDISFGDAIKTHIQDIYICLKVIHYLDVNERITYM